VDPLDDVGIPEIVDLARKLRILVQVEHRAHRPVAEDGTLEEALSKVGSHGRSMYLTQ
jgi:hypothetical protein